MDIGILKDAMKRRSGKGIDIQLIIDGKPHDVVPAQSEQVQMAQSGLGNDEEPEEEKLMDLAPEVKDSKSPADEGESMDEMLSEGSNLPMHKKMMAMKAAKLGKK